MANEEKMWETFDCIVALPKQEQWNQETFVDHNNECGTVHCVAGWRAELDGWYPVLLNDGYGKPRPVDFWTRQPGVVVTKTELWERMGVYLNASTIAKQSMELTDTEAVTLFYDFQENDTGELKEVIQDIIAGKYKDTSMGWQEAQEYENENDDD